MGQSFLHEGRHSWDALKCVHLKTKQEVSLYFNIDRVVAKEEELFRK